MRSSLLLFASLLCTAPAFSQTPGIAFVNDYWITPGGLPGGLSCKPLTVVTPLVITLNFSCAPNTPFVVFWSTCPCTACFPIPPIGLSACLPPPTLACPPSNQFLELGFGGGCSLISIAAVSNAAGGATILIPVPKVGAAVTLSTQTVFLGAPACVAPPFGVLLSQAWSVTFK